MIRILVCRVGEDPRTETTCGSLEAMQALVGGYIQAVPLGLSINIICNEDGALLGLPPNRCGILGDFFYTKFSPEGEAVTLTDKDAMMALIHAEVFRDERPGRVHPIDLKFKTVAEMEAYLENLRYGREHRN